MLRCWDNRPYLAKLGDAISQLFNALAGGAPDESLSGRSWRITKLEPTNSRTWFWEVIKFAAEALFYIRDRGQHTRLAFEEDVTRSYNRGKYLNQIKRTSTGDIVWIKKRSKTGSTC